MLLIVLVCALLMPPARPDGSVAWHASGVLTETCTCAVPCTCNFGQGPSPHSYCHTLFAFGITTGEYGGVRLDGLKIAAVRAQGGKVLFLDERATTAQRPALERIARIMCRQGVGPDDLSESARKEWRAILYVPITQELGARFDRLEIPGYGGFRADYIMGRDPNRPVVVENNTTWAIERAIKAKTTYFRYKDRWGNVLDLKDTNANHGGFSYTEKSRLSPSVTARS